LKTSKHDYKCSSGTNVGRKLRFEVENTPGSSNEVPIRILIVIRQHILRNGLSAMIGAQPGFHVVGTAANCAQCFRQASVVEPDILLCDLETEEKPQKCAANGEGLGTFRKKLPELPAIVLHGDVKGRRVMGASRLGVQGYLTMDASPDNLFQAIRVVARGGSYVDQKLHSMLMELAAGRNENNLNQREHRILQLLSEGRNNHESADTLFVSKGTVKHYVSIILTKLDASNRTEAVRKAVVLDLL